ncbi:MAG: TerC family protein, partial [Planctomycetia bacterium]
MPYDFWLWTGFNLFIVLMLALDLGVFHRHAHALSVREALGWTGVWVSLAIGFMGFLYFYRGPADAVDYLAGYLLEYSLSVDNIFVFLMIFGHFKVPALYQHKILFWGILGAVLMRAAFIFLGAELLKHFAWLFYVFGGFLIFTGIKMLFHKEEEEVKLEEMFVLRMVKRLLPTSPRYHGDHFFVKENGRTLVTPMFVVLVLVETTDLLFAVDSIPAIFGITKDPLIVYTSNIFAILGLRSLYFALSGIMGMFHYLRFGLALVLTLIGVKMVVAEAFHLDVPSWMPLSAIVGILATSVVASIVLPPKKPPIDP